MRTLKKTLSLILVLVMVLGLATSAFAKTSFVDDAKIEYAEAAAVLTAVGLAQGNEKGEYNPQGDMTRAEAATFITRLVGMEGLNAKSTFPDMAGYDWAQPYVAFCQSQGFVSGDENGNFKPSEKITGYTFGKMLLCALGYDAVQEGLVGDSWSFNIAKLLLAKDLTSGLPSSFDLSKILSRDEAGQMLFNTLTAVMMEYRNNFTASGDNFNVSISGKASAVEGSNETDYYADYENDTTGATGDGLMQLCEQFFKKLKKNDADGDDATDVFGRPNSYTWTYDGTPVYTVEKTPFLTYTKAVKADAIEKALRNYSFAATPVVEDPEGGDPTGGEVITNLYVNGQPIDGAFDGSDGDFDLIEFLTGNGALVELFANSSKAITDVVVVYYNVGKVSVEKDEDGDVTYDIEDVDDLDGWGTGELSFITSMSGTIYADEDTDDEVVLGGEIEDGAIVTYTNGIDADDNVIVYIYPTTLVTGDQESTTQPAAAGIAGTSFRATDGDYAGKVNVSGTSYTIGDAVGATLDFYSNTDGTDTYFYLDQYGYAVHHAAVDTTTNYAVVLRIAQAVGGLDSDNVKARLLFVDGTTKDVVVTANKNGNDVDAETTGAEAFDIDPFCKRALFGTGAEGDEGISDSYDGNMDYHGLIVTYKVDDDGNYKLTDATSTWVNTVAEDTEITKKGNPKIDDGTNAAIAGKDSTIYLVATGENSTTYNVYTGYDNVTSLKVKGDADNVYVSVAKDTKGEYAKVVFVDIGDDDVSSDESKDVLFVANYEVTKKGEKNATYSIQAYLNGELKTVYGTEDALAELGEEEGELYYKGELFVVKGYNSKGEITGVELADPIYTVLINASGTSLVTDDGEEGEIKWSYPSSAKTYVIRENPADSGKWTLRTGSINDAKAATDTAPADQVYIVPKGQDSSTDAKTVKAIYIIKGGLDRTPPVTFTVETPDALNETSGDVTFSAIEAKIDGTPVVETDADTATSGQTITYEIKYKGTEAEDNLGGEGLTVTFTNADITSVNASSNGTWAYTDGTGDDPTSITYRVTKGKTNSSGEDLTLTITVEFTGEDGETLAKPTVEALTVKKLADTNVDTDTASGDGWDYGITADTSTKGYAADGDTVTYTVAVAVTSGNSGGKNTSETSKTLTLTGGTIPTDWTGTGFTNPTAAATSDKVITLKSADGTEDIVAKTATVTVTVTDASSLDWAE